MKAYVLDHKETQNEENTQYLKFAQATNTTNCFRFWTYYFTMRTGCISEPQRSSSLSSTIVLVLYGHFLR
jgi:hypothetical protein